MIRIKVEIRFKIRCRIRARVRVRRGLVIAMVASKVEIRLGFGDGLRR